MRVRVDLAYDGAGFHGWARQPGLRTVQGELETALATVLRVPEVSVTCAGRTDTGVHARGQVCHLDVADDALTGAAGRSTGAPARAVATRLNGLLPADVRVRALRGVPDDFDARVSALWRRYAYRVADDPGTVDPLTRGHVLSWRHPLDLEAMNLAGGALLGEHDFAAFCKRREGATTVRTLLDLQWARDASGVAVATVRADAFCHHMVRSLMGALLAAGEGRRPPDWPAGVLRAGVRDSAVPVLPAHALTLEEVGYPADDELGARAEASRRMRSVEAP
ncbi:tRNA pseudouridine(38-40) synthase TruA [Nocardioides sp.]|uniref:tRNA pseudouridine(38-40) synthase TruA n=1 Tax=Nocardioides sp. TaxID=35761 RepID=UPI003527E51E